MKALQQSFIGKLLAACLLLAFSFFGVLSGLRTINALPFTDLDSWQDSGSFYRAIESRQEELASYFAQQKVLTGDDSLPYLDRQQLLNKVRKLEAQFASDATWFRFQVRSTDGQEILFSNLDEGESLAQSVYRVQYASFIPGEYSVSTGSMSYQGNLSSAQMQQVASTPLVIECGVLSQPDDNRVSDEFSRLYNQYQTSQQALSLYAFFSLLCIGGILATMFFLLWAAGHKTGTEGIVLGWQERIYFDVYFSIMLLLGTAAVVGAINLGYLSFEYEYYALYTSQPDSQLSFLIALSCAAVTAVFFCLLQLTLQTLVLRIKAHTLGKSTLICLIFSRLWHCIVTLMRSLPFLWRIVAAYLVFFVINIQLLSQAQYNGFFGLLVFVWNILALLLLCWWAVSFRHLQKGSQAIAAGNLNHQIDTLHMPNDLKLHAEELNNISVGLSSALEEKMKSERFKAELITNVSHDLKTPLTSIINYVNLLKTTNQTDTKAQEYIEVLDRKSQRLKKLTEDLVEASKASTGVLSVNREKIGMAQLIDQALGEWEERLQARSLSVMTNLPEGETWVFADGRHLWRVIDNLLSNCAKYAMEGTRVYLDLNRGHGQVTLSVKNISRDALNVPPERLMERFVRGEESRTTEGSGLGLSIARSLTELQGGTFQLTVDGDLFKSVVTLPQAN